jgi:hypothetical protein
MKLLKAFAATLLFLALLLTVYYIHVSFLKVDVLFYSAVGDGVLATAITATLLYGWPYLALFNRFEKFQLCLIWLLGAYIFAISVPTVIDRSLSFYLLEKIQQRGGGIRLASFEDVIGKEYVKEHRLVDIRLTEQQQSGTIVIERGCVKLTEEGMRIATASRFFRQHFLPKQRLLMGRYTDDLIDPFRHSQAAPDYACQ